MPGRIRILPEILSNKIAAGEVVERPASVVRELIENALDARSTRIITEVEKGGRSLIRVSDNGIGMSHDDALLSVERYATSKIYKDDDLFSVRTLGFRGEALPSIASVSRFTLETSDGRSDTGIRIEMAGGKIKNVSEIGAPAGTQITVSQLFFNTPARRKFLKTIRTEMGHISDSVAGIALGRPGVRFRLLHDGQTLRQWTAASDPADRIADVLGSGVRNDLRRVELADDAVAVIGWVASPHVTRSTSRGIHTYVNGRLVRDRTIQHALFRGYEGRLMKGQFPVAVLFIQVPPDQVDVNVHPTKNEVRFAEQRRVHSLVMNAVSSVISISDRPGWLGEKRSEPSPPLTRVSEKPDRFTPAETPPRTRDEASEEMPCAEFPGAMSEGRAEKKPFSPARQSPLWEQKFFGHLRVIGQFRGTYLLCESDDALVLIDQHAAHERVMFEQLKERSPYSGASQKLLIPETVDLSYSEAGILEKLIPDFRGMGLDIEPFGGTTFVVKSVPALLGSGEIRPLITEMVEKIADVGFASGLEKAMDECLMIMACHGAIRANQQLSGEQVRALLQQLDQCQNPSHCPHGRPTWIRWDIAFLEKSFKRIV